MKRSGLIFVISSVLIFGLILFISAAEHSGDGTYTVQKGDIITVDNGWKIEILSVGIGSVGQIVNFVVYDSDGNEYPDGAPAFYNKLMDLEGRKKFGSDTRLRVEMEVLNVSGETLATAGVSWVEKEYARINVVSVDEALPGSAGEGGLDPNLQEVDKVLTYKNGRAVSLGIGEETILGNGYKLKLDSFDSRWGSPYFSLYNSDGVLIDDGIASGKEVSRSLGSLVYVKNYANESVDLLVVDGSKITFGTGWNMFSISLEDGDGYGTVLESTCNNASLWAWNNNLKDYEKIGVLEEGGKLPAGKGIWAKIQTKKDTVSDMDCDVIVSGTKTVTTEGIKLKAGWNLIGAPLSSYGYREVVDGGSNFYFLTFQDILGDCRIEKGPWQFLSTMYTDTSIVSDVAETGKYSPPFESRLRLNRGYFIKVIDDCTLSDK